MCSTTAKEQASHPWPACQWRPDVPTLLLDTPASCTLGPEGMPAPGVGDHRGRVLCASHPGRCPLRTPLARSLRVAPPRASAPLDALAEGRIEALQALLEPGELLRPSVAVLDVGGLRDVEAPPLGALIGLGPFERPQGLFDCLSLVLQARIDIAGVVAVQSQLDAVLATVPLMLRIPGAGDGRQACARAPDGDAGPASGLGAMREEAAGALSQVVAEGRPVVELQLLGGREGRGGGGADGAPPVVGLGDDVEAGRG